MSSVSKNKVLALMGIFFLLGIVLISYELLIWGVMPILILVFIYVSFSQFRPTASLFVFFLLGTIVFQIGDEYLASLDVLKEAKVILNRCMLLFIICGLLISLTFSKQKIFIIRKEIDWRGRIAFPSHSIKLPYFLFIGLIGSSTIFIPLLFQDNLHFSQSFLFYGISFSIINAFLEEFLWRGIMLSSLKSNTSILYAVVVTSIGFGLLHISIGIPLIMSLLFSLGGMFYAFVVLKFKNIYPAIIFHFIINLGMVSNGWIF